MLSSMPGIILSVLGILVYLVITKHLMASSNIAPFYRKHRGGLGFVHTTSYIEPGFKPKLTDSRTTVLNY
jgi:hypothetical protein